ncbi:MAG: class I SAM-dependent methyltransferase [Gammaproteobacteria bacterium]|nr:class I SAM-dependent methyltransferase [Gammaproteobacteria bacterium]
MSNKFKKEVLTAFQKVSPSRINIEDDEMLRKYTQSHYNLFFRKLKFPPELFKGKTVIDFGCGTGEVDVVLANWGADVRGFDFNPISVERANGLKDRFKVPGQLRFSVGDIDAFEIEPASADLSVSFGVIAHVPDQKHMFQRMAQTAKPGGYLILGYVEDAGLIQRLLHRAIVRVNADKTDEEIFRIAQTCFAEHIDRSVQYGGRTAASVINDYLVNPHYLGLSSNTLMNWATGLGLEFYSTCPNTDLPFVVDSPYFMPISRTSEVYKLFTSLNRLRWLFAQQEDSTVFSEIKGDMDDLGEKIETFLSGLNGILQDEVYTDVSLADFRGQLRAVSDAFDRAGLAVLAYARKHLEELGGELDRVLTLIVRKATEGKDFDLKQVQGLLFKGYNGLGTNYTVWHRPA